MIGKPRTVTVAGTTFRSVVRIGGALAQVSLQRDPAGFTVAAALDLYHGTSHDGELVQRLASARG